MTSLHGPRATAGLGVSALAVVLLLLVLGPLQVLAQSPSPSGMVSSPVSAVVSPSALSSVQGVTAVPSGAPPATGTASTTDNGGSPAPLILVLLVGSGLLGVVGVTRLKANR